MTIEPFDLRQPTSYDLVVDRLTHWYTTSREWIKKAVIMDGLYVFNNPWAIQSMEKHTSYCAMIRLGMPIPETWMVPPKRYEPKPDLEVTLARYARLFDLGDVGNEVGFPLFAKPYDGGGWAGVSRVDDEEALHRAYDASGTYLLHLQRAVEPHDLFVRCIGFGPQARLVRYDPSAPLHDRYTMDDGGVPDDQRQDADRHDDDDQLLLRMGVQLVRGIAPGRRPGIRSTSPTPAPTHRSRRCTTTSRGWSRQSALVAVLRGDEAQDAGDTRLDAVLRIADTDAPTRRSSRIRGDRPEAVPDRRVRVVLRDAPLPPRPVVWDFFGDPVANDAVRQKVAALFPAHEVDDFTDLFWQRIQRWRADNVPSRAE